MMFKPLSQAIFFAFLIALFLIQSPLLYAQDQEFSFSLQEAQAYAVKHGYQTRLAQKDVEKAERKVKETIGTGLPQVDAAANYENYLTFPIQLVPAESFGGPEGEFVEFVFGTEQRMGAQLNASQLVFDGSYFVGLQAAKVYEELAKNDLKKAEIDIRNLVTGAYAGVLISEKNAEVLKMISENLDKNFTESEALYKEGFIGQENKDQMELLMLNAENAFLQAERQLPIARNQLKFILGIPLDKEITLTDELDQVVEGGDQQAYLSTDFNVEQHIDYTVVNTQLEATELLLKQQRSTYLPTLNAFYSYQENSFSNEFNFFDDAPWFPTELIGLNLSVPLFSGFSRKNRVEQAKLDVEKVELSKQLLEQQLRLNVTEARSEYSFALQQYQNRKRNLELATRIYNKTEIKYDEGLSSSTELTQANNQLVEAEANYIQAAFQLINARTNLNKALNIQ
jgi:outer membrane protein TolC